MTFKEFFDCFAFAIFAAIVFIAALVVAITTMDVTTWIVTGVLLLATVACVIIGFKKKKALYSDKDEDAA